MMPHELTARALPRPSPKVVQQAGGGDYLQRILTSRVYDVAVETPLERAPNLSERLGNNMLLKREDMQPVFSFKLRGAYNKMVRLSAAALRRGVITASAGNHAQGVALSAQRLGCSATIVMPVTTPRIKSDAVAARGAEVVLAGESYDEAYRRAVELAKARRLTFVHPYDDPDVIAGQGTIGIEILRQHPDPIEAIFVAVGGGGLLAGVCEAVKSLRPDVKVIGVQPADSDAMARSLEAGKRVTLAHAGLFADGVAVKRVGEETFRIARQHADGMIRVGNDEICAAIKDVFEDTRSILEPAGALAIAGAKVHAEKIGGAGRTLVAVASGANINFNRLRFVAERAEMGEHREAILAVTIPERPGSFLRFCRLLGSRHITEFNYRMSDAEAAQVFVGVAIQGREEIGTIVGALVKQGLPTIDLSDDEVAKLHVRHLVGGHAALACDERVYRFEFPERPGALLRFLSAMRTDWNISLFHYRNHGADYGRVLVGIQVPAEETDRFQRFLGIVGYPFFDETSNPAYRLFLG